MGKFLASLLFLAVVGGGQSLTFQEKYDIWSVDLMPGFMIQPTVMDGRRCYCKVPEITTTSTTTSTTTTATTTSTSTSTSTSTTTSTSTSTTSTSTSTSTSTTTSTSTSTTSTSTSTSTSTTTSTSTSTTSTSTSTSTSTTTSTSTSTTSTSTSTSTSTTTSTSTSTTSTSTSTSTSTTSTSTSTSTSTTTSTTTETSTSTTSSTTVDYCGACDKTFTVTQTEYPKNGSIYSTTWLTPNYPENYPDGCSCTFTFTIHGSGFVQVAFESDDKIYTDSNCEIDHLEFTGDLQNVNNKHLCDLSNEKGYMMSSSVSSALSFTALFVSSCDDDCKVGKGFKMTVTFQTM
ncbi:cell wall protein DAN4-like isoform X3 [Penaeus chinensis]|uniref:cell wall protein DAN4-like isoform X3 n=1 Tax=Penaeus chinensis TaxID=139456 RepID=UPI001FB6BE89|nr:cell wall protein DAN4-like isoform X3 [Penaeus chinensis]